jgi:hypothetical protein
MKTFTIILAAVVFTCWLNSCETAKSDKQTAISITPSKDDLVKRGTYLVTTSGCNDCHSPKHMGTNGPEIDSLTMLSGFPSNRPIPVANQKDVDNGMIVFNEDLTACTGPWGTSFAGNITSDETGIGNWTEAQFKNALRKGKYKGLDGGRMLMPPMPWEDFRNLTDDDVEAIFYYLKSTKPVKNIVPQLRLANVKK